MLENIAEVLKALDYIGSKVYTKTDVYLVQGAALIFRGLKERTKDIDICCGYQEANRIVAALRPHGRMESLFGIGDTHFVRFYLKSFVLDIFIRDMWLGDEYAILEKAQCDDLVFGQVTFKVPDVKTLLAVKDRQTQALLEETRNSKTKE